MKRFAEDGVHGRIVPVQARKDCGVSGYAEPRILNSHQSELFPSSRVSCGYTVTGF